MAKKRIDTRMYSTLVFFQGDDAAPVLEEIDKRGARRTIDRLLTEGYGDFDAAGADEPTPNWGAGDSVVFWGGCALAWNDRIGYVGLDKVTRLPVEQFNYEKLLAGLPTRNNGDIWRSAI